MTTKNYVSKLYSLIRCCSVLLFAVFCSFNTFGQIHVISGGAGLAATYPSFTRPGGLFAALNANNQTGQVIVVSIVADVLNESAANGLTGAAGMWTSLTITPVGVRTLSGIVVANLFDFNGADNVIIDGLNSGGNSLTITNLAVGSSNTIRFIADATNNTIQNCTLKGSGSNPSFAVVNFSTGTITGNDGNNINHCNIQPAGANLPLNSVFSLGTSAAINNSGNTIDANNISDFFNATLTSVGINISNINTNSSSAWTITNNRLFQTAQRIYTTAHAHNGIFIGGGAGYTIMGNTIGFANAAGTGKTIMAGNSTALSGTFPVAWNNTGTSNATSYIGISCNFLPGGAVSSIQNNTIAGFALYTGSGITTSAGIFCGIHIGSGNVNIGTSIGNTIGSTTGQGSIYTACNTAGGTVAGINVTSANTVTIRNNSIGAIDAAGAVVGSGCGGITGIDVAGTGTYTISDNTIGNATANNMRAGNLATGATLSNTGAFITTAGIGAIVGIRSSATGATLNITGNTLRGFAMSTTASSAGSAFTGIINTGAASNAVNITGNFLGTAFTGLLNYAFAIGANSVFNGISSTGSGAAATLSISNNDFQGVSYAVAGDNAHNYINCSAVLAGFTANLNTFTNLNVNTTGTVTLILMTYTTSTGTGTKTVTNNSIINGFNRGGVSGSLLLINDNGNSVTGTLTSVQNNNFSNITVAGTTIINGINLTDGGTGSTKSVSGNMLNNWTAVTGDIKTININSFNGASSVSNNAITNITGQAAVTGITMGSTVNTATSLTCSSNTITNLTSTGIGGLVQGILCSNTSPVININNNSISTLSSTSATNNLNGIQITGATQTNIFKNTIGDLSISGAITTQCVNGILLSNNLPAINVYNNRIGDLRAPFANDANALIGINANTTGSTNAINMYYNSVYLNGTSSGALFGSSAISASSTPVITLNNNIFHNASSANGSGLAVAYRRSTSDLTNYNVTSDRNDFFASIIYSDGPTPHVTLAAYKTLVTTRDANSKSEAPVYLSTTSSNANFLKINTLISSQLESGAANLAAIITDFENNIRQGNPGYPAQLRGGGTAPDIGADEFDGQANCSTSQGGNALGDTTFCGSVTPVISAANYSSGSVYQWYSSEIFSDYPNSGTAVSGQTNPASLATGVISRTTYFWLRVTCATNSSSANSTMVTITVSPVIANCSKTNIVCKGQSTGSITVNAGGGTPGYTYLWTGGNTNQTRNNLAAGTYTVTVTDSQGCTTSSSSVITQPATALSLNTTKSNAKCFGSANGYTTVSPVGGTTPYQYLWNTTPAQTTASITGLVAGVYSCNVTDAIGCTKTAVITITQPTILNVIPSQTNVSTQGGFDGSASVAVSGGTPAYTYSWNTVPVKTTASITGLSAGVYKCTILDSKNCQVKITFTITQPTPKTAEAIDEMAGLHMSPNPTNGKFKVSINQSNMSNYFCVIEDVSGKLILKQSGSVEAGQHEINLDLTGMAKGIYIMKWFDDKLSTVKRIVLQ